MSSVNGNNIISQLRNRWQIQALIARSLPALGAATLLTTILHTVYGTSFTWIIPITLILILIGVLASGSWKFNEKDVARNLDEQFPELQASTSLLLKENEKLGLLERLQLNRITSVIQDVQPTSPVISNLKSGSILLACSLILALLIWKFEPFAGLTKSPVNEISPVDGMKEEKLIPHVTGLTLAIDPPAYTAKTKREQTRFNIRAEEGSKLTWNIYTKGRIDKVELLFNDSTSISLQADARNSQTFTGSRQINKNGFYQLRIGNTVSELYQLEIIQDQRPVITVQTPKPSLLVEFGQSQIVPLNAGLTDDYGTVAASIIATIASGSGEAVKFKEQKLSFRNFNSGSKDQKLTQDLNLKALGLQPGDELYYYIVATDNNKQESRSDIHTIRLEDTAALMSMDGMMSGVDVKPEFFRSQRQIIIETELLLKGRDTMTKELFNARCNDLGIDQKLLRLRYGKFLGEESETNIGEDGNTGDDHNDEHVKGGEHHEDKDGHEEEVSIEDFNNADKLIERYSHKHDIAEDATFFDPETKKELRATLAEMWKSELRLRTYVPAEALPFEYKALRLLKELQQKSREYVAKTTTKTTPLKPEKRLTGELDKIVEVSSKETFKSTSDRALKLRSAISLINSIRINNDQSVLTSTQVELV
ncbi:MAG: DUF4175 family protein, partial [Chitinophagaceae bacterium]